MSYKSYKSGFDLILALVLGILLMPLMMVISIVLWITQGRVLFIQERPGFQGESFKMLKFITMREDESSTDQERVTHFGRFLRKLSLDELPQIWNILRGDMSFIGPRPFLPEYLPLYSEYHQKRHHVLPGITGLAQVSGRNQISWEQKLDMDSYYSENINWLLDLKIVGLTMLYFLEGCPGTYPANKFIGYE